jgi:uncharacterized glyoxalase superfamily protein PhnB
VSSSSSVKARQVDRSKAGWVGEDVHLDDPAATTKAFNALAEGGTIKMALTEAPWARQAG